MDKDLILLNEAILCYKYFLRELFSLQNAFYYKTSRFCYTTQQALQNTLFLLQNVAGIKKMRRLLQNAATTARVSVKNL